MRHFCLLIRAFALLLFAVFGSFVASGAQEDWSRLSYPIVVQKLSSQPSNLTFAARAPPTTSENVSFAVASSAGTSDVRASYNVVNLGDVSAFLVSSIAPKGAGRFDAVQPRDANEAQFLANAEATFGNSTTWGGVTRHRNELVIQRSDIELSPQNITRMRNGQAPFVRGADGAWEPIQLHHVGRETGKMIEVTRSQNRYNSATGGPLHIPGPGGPVRQPGYSQSYWEQRYQDFVNSGQITP